MRYMKMKVSKHESKTKNIYNMYRERTEFVGPVVGSKVVGNSVGDILGLNVGGGVGNGATQLFGRVGSHSGSVLEQSEHFLRHVPSPHAGAGSLRC